MEGSTSGPLVHLRRPNGEACTPCAPAWEQLMSAPSSPRLWGSESPAAPQSADSARRAGRAASGEGTADAEMTLDDDDFSTSRDGSANPLGLVFYNGVRYDCAKCAREKARVKKRVAHSGVGRCRLLKPGARGTCCSAVGTQPAAGVD